MTGEPSASSVSPSRQVMTLTAVEQRVVDAALRGSVVDLSPEQVAEAALGERVSNNPERGSTVRAEVIRSLLQGRDPASGDHLELAPRAMHLVGGTIDGELDLGFIEAVAPLTLSFCNIPSGVSAECARLPGVLLDRCLVSAVVFDNARIGADLNMNGTTLADNSLASLSADGLEVGGGLYLAGRFNAAGGVRLTGARVGGQLTMSGAHLTSDVGPALDADGLRVESNLYLDGGFTATGVGPGGAVVLAGARVGGRLGMRGAILTNDSGPALIADSMAVERDVYLIGGFTASGAGEGGAVRFPGAHVGGQLRMTGASLTNDSGPALYATQLVVDQDLFMDEGFVAAGGIRLKGAQVGQLSLSGATLTNDSGPAMHAENLVVDRNLSLGDQFRASGTGAGGAVRLPDARIGGQLGMPGATLSNDSGPALHADRVAIGNGWYSVGLTATGAGEGGAVRLPGAHVGAQMALTGATLRNDSGPALNADNVAVGSSLFLDLGFTATGAGLTGVIRLSGARIGDQLVMHGATLTNHSGPALLAKEVITTGDLLLDNGFAATGAIYLPGANIGGSLGMRRAILASDSGSALLADRLSVARGLHLDEGFTATGSGLDGTVRLPGGHIDGQLSFRGASLANASGPALFADRLTVDGGVLLDEGFTATGRGIDGTMRLPGAHVTGPVIMRGAILTNDSGPALHADEMVIDGSLYLDEKFRISGKKATVHLSNARMTGTFAVDRPVVESAFTEARHWVVDGLSYAGVPGCGVRTWLEFLRKGTSGYRPQPYQQLAAAARAQGHNSEARSVQIAQRRDQLARGDLRRGRKLWTLFTGLFLGFGYQPLRVLSVLLTTVVVALTLTLIFWSSAFHRTDASSRVNSPSVQPATCSVVERAGLALDASLPLVQTGWADSCRPDATMTGNTWRLTALLLQLVSWASVTLFVAGYTRIIRDP